MTTGISLRKPKLHFDAAAHPSHVTFDDGQKACRNLAWAHYSEARCDYSEPDTIKIEIGPWLIVLRGHNLGPLFSAIEEQSLMRVCARPELAEDLGREFLLERFFGGPIQVRLRDTRSTREWCCSMKPR